MCKKHRRFSMIQNEHMKAVYDDDLVTLLKSLKVYDEITNGKILCKYCQQQITLENLGAIIPADGEIAFPFNYLKTFYGRMLFNFIFLFISDNVFLLHNIPLSFFVLILFICSCYFFIYLFD